MILYVVVVGLLVMWIDRSLQTKRIGRVEVTTTPLRSLLRCSCPLVAVVVGGRVDESIIEIDQTIEYPNDQTCLNAHRSEKRIPLGYAQIEVIHARQTGNQKGTSNLRSSRSYA